MPLHLTAWLLKNELRANYSDVRVYLPVEGENLQKLDIDIDVKDIYGNVLSEKCTRNIFQKSGVYLYPTAFRGAVTLLSG